MTIWPVLCTLFALVLLLVLIIRYQMQAFVALLLASLMLGLAAGMEPTRVLKSIAQGIGDITRNVIVLLALGAMIGRLLDTTGAAEVIARTLIGKLGVSRAPLAILIAGYLIGIPVLFNVGFLLLIPIMWRLQRETGQSLLYYALPLTFSLGITHSLVPPHPGIVTAIARLGGAEAPRVLVETILFGSLLGVPMVLLGWYGPGRAWARRQHVEPPAALMGQFASATAVERQLPSFRLALAVVTLPLVLSLLGFGVKLLDDAGALPAALTQGLAPALELPSALGLLRHPPVAWLQFLGEPVMALLVPTGLGFWLLGGRQGLSRGQLAKVAGDALQDVGGVLFLFAAAGGFMQVIDDSKAGQVLATQMRQLPLSPVLIAYLVAVVLRIALGSATASISAAAGILADYARSLPGHETFLVLAVANGVTFLTQPADSGFWQVKEYMNISERDILLRLNPCRMVMSLFGVSVLLLCEWLLM